MPRIARPVFAGIPHHITQRGNRRENVFFDDEAYLWAALRYAELNPVRAKMAQRAENYTWSSAAAHCGIRQDPLLTSQHERIG